MKRPASQWYWADWLRDPAIRASSLEARGLWMDMLALMHEGTPYGHLTVGGEAVTDLQLARMVGETPARVRKLLKELEAHGVFSRTDSGVMYSRRMVRDEEKRSYAANCGDASTRPTSARSGTTGALFNFLATKWKGCLWCGGKDALELHRIVAGRHGGKYEPGNVLILCHDDHETATYGELTVAAILAKHSLNSPIDLFAGFEHGKWTIPSPHTPRDTPTNTPPIPSSSSSSSSSSNYTSSTRVRARLEEADRPAFDTLISRVPSPETWSAECEAMLDGMHGPKVPPALLARAIKDVIANGKLEIPNIRQFRRYVQGAAQEKESVAAPAAREYATWLYEIFTKRGFARQLPSEEHERMIEEDAARGTIKNKDRFRAHLLAVKPWTWLGQAREIDKDKSIARIAQAIAPLQGAAA